MEDGRAEKSLRDGFVRNVEVKYKNIGAKTTSTKVNCPITC